jgi:hypothetical protein
MKNKNLNLLVALVTILCIFSSCEKDNSEPDKKISKSKADAYVVNYGTMSGSKSTIQKYDTEKDTLYDKAYEDANGVAVNSNIQHMAVYNGKAYMASNDGDKIDIVDANTLEATVNPVSTDITIPRYIVFSGGMAYVSCWGSNPDYNVMPNSYIAVLDLEANSVDHKINMPGGCEGLAVANNKLYVALNYTDSIGVVDLSTEDVSYIETPAVTSYFLKDEQDNLYVSLISTYSDPTNTEGLGYINTSTDALVDTFKISGVSAGYTSMMAFNATQDTIFVIASSWVDDGTGNWIQTGKIEIFDVASQQFSTTPFIAADGINAVSVDPNTNEVHCLFNPAATQNGKMEIRSSSGGLKATLETGISPNRVVFVE